MFSVCVFFLRFISVCFLSVFSLCVFSLCFLSVCFLAVCSRCVFSLCFCLCFLSGFAFHRTAKTDTFLSFNIHLILQWSGLADELLLADINAIKGWWSATSQLLWLQYKYQTLTLYFGLSGYPASSFYKGSWLFCRDEKLQAECKIFHVYWSMCGGLNPIINRLQVTSAAHLDAIAWSLERRKLIRYHRVGYLMVSDVAIFFGGRTWLSNALLPWCVCLLFVVLFCFSCVVCSVFYVEKIANKYVDVIFSKRCFVGCCCMKMMNCWIYSYYFF